MVYGRVWFFELGAIVSVEVPASQGATIVTNYHTVRVQHWYHLEDKSISKNLCQIIKRTCTYAVNEKISSWLKISSQINLLPFLILWYIATVTPLKSSPALTCVLWILQRCVRVCVCVCVCVCTLASGEFDMRKSSSPFIIHDPLVSPGWTLPVTTTTFLLLFSSGDWTYSQIE